MFFSNSKHVAFLPHYFWLRVTPGRGTPISVIKQVHPEVTLIFGGEERSGTIDGMTKVVRGDKIVAVFLSLSADSGGSISLLENYHNFTTNRPRDVAVPDLSSPEENREKPVRAKPRSLCG